MLFDLQCHREHDGRESSQEEDTRCSETPGRSRFGTKWYDSKHNRNEIYAGSELTTSRVSLVIFASYMGTCTSEPVRHFWLSAEKCPLDSALHRASNTTQYSNHY